MSQSNQALLIIMGGVFAVCGAENGYLVGGTGNTVHVWNRCR